MTTRTFHKTIFQITVLSEDPLPQMELNEIHDAITTGDCSGEVTTVSASTLTGKEAADELTKQGSDPGFFMLTEDGDEIT